MVASSGKKIKVVRQIAGPGTGDKILIDEFGNRWTVVSYLPPKNTDEKQGTTDGQTIWVT